MTWIVRMPSQGQSPFSLYLRVERAVADWSHWVSDATEFASEAAARAYCRSWQIANRTNAELEVCDLAEYLLEREARKAAR